MSYRPGVIGHGYNDCILRVERRPADRPYTKEQMERWLDEFAEAGVDAWWTGVSAKGSYPLFSSKYLPYREDCATDLYPWLVEEAHKRGIVLVSWEYLNTAPLLTQQHPDWRVKYLKGNELFTHTERDDHFVCFNSPYGDLLKDYCVEVFNDLGIDAIWFDGSYLYNVGTDGYRWSCCCDKCAEAFGNATGEEIPTVVDWNSPVFKKFVDWRYQMFEDYWADLSSYVRQRSPESLIILNFFNRHFMGATSGSPLRHRKIDAMTASEGWSTSVNMLVKTTRAVNDTFPNEVWTNFLDGSKVWYPHRPNPDPASNLYFTQSAAASGGFASFGIADHFDSQHTLSIMGKKLQYLKHNVGGKEMASVGLVYSGFTKDWAYDTEEGDRSNNSRHKPVVENVYGFASLLNALHKPFEIVLDNQLDEMLKKYDAVIFPDVQCMEDDALSEVESYINQGGTVIITGDTGLKYRQGELRNKGLFDDLLGITSRTSRRDLIIMKPDEPFLSPDLPPEYMINGTGRAVEVSPQTKVLATGVLSKPTGRTTDTGHTLPCSMEGVKEDESGAVIVEKEIGKGRLIYIAAEIGSGYSRSTCRRSRFIVNQLLQNISVPFKTDAPANVMITMWENNGRHLLHVLNQPATVATLVTGNFVIHPEDFTPVAPFTITVPDIGYTKISCPSADKEAEYSKADKQITIDVTGLETHHLFVLES